MRIAEACVPSYKVDPEPGSDWTVNMEPLYNLAQTCRTLQESALDVMWYRQAGLENLIWILPPRLRDKVLLSCPIVNEEEYTSDFIRRWRNRRQSGEVCALCSHPITV